MSQANLKRRLHVTDARPYVELHDLWALWACAPFGSMQQPSRASHTRSPEATKLAGAWSVMT
jgi:hypothetical protein